MDAAVDPGWLGPLVVCLESHPDAGAASPLLALADGLHVNALGQDVHVTGLGFNRGLGAPIADAPREPFPVPGIQGAAFLVRRALVDRMGGLDESGFLYHEDVDLSWLLRMMGHSLWCVPASRVRHDYFLSMYPEKLHLLERNRWAMLLTCLAPASLAALAPVLTLTEALVWSYCLVRGPAFLRAKARTFAWLWRQRATLRARRARAQSLRRRPDRDVLAALRWRYSARQFLALARERGPGARQPWGGPPRAIP
jgi:hypothetical protein